MKIDSYTQLGFSFSVDLHISRVICIGIPGLFIFIKPKDKDVGNEGSKCFLCLRP